MMDASRLPKISSDAHVDEPHDLWFERLDESLRGRAPRRIQSDEDGGWTLVVDGTTVGWSNLSAQEAKEKEDARIAAATFDARLDMMRTDSINGEIIYPTIGLYAWNIEDPQVGRAACRIYNDWILERLGGHPRIRVAGMIPTWDLEMARAEIERIADHAVHRRYPPAPRRYPRVEHAGVGAALECHCRDRETSRDAPGDGPRHDLLPWLGERDGKPPCHPDNGAAGGSAVQL